jgi:hypothetical protein
MWLLVGGFLRLNRIVGLARMLSRVDLTISREHWFNSIHTPTPDRDTKKHISPPVIIRPWTVGGRYDRHSDSGGNEFADTPT